MFEPTRTQLEAAKKVLQSRFQPFPNVVVVLGSGFASVVEHQRKEAELSFLEIPGFPEATVGGHAGTLSISKVGKNTILWMSGRPHFYEGLSWKEVLFPFRAIAWSGAETFILTNAAGGLNPAYKTGDLILIQDHINNLGSNPLRGPHESFLGPRFVEMRGTYDASLRQQIHAASKKAEYPLQDGVYIACSGPTYETEAEAKLYQSWGADVVGMSTVPEALALRQMNRRIAAISCVANASGGDGITHDEVLKKVNESADTLDKILFHFFS